MPSGYINPRIHINPPRPHRPSLWLRFRTWWNATDLDSQLAERVDRAQRWEPSSRQGTSYRGLSMGLVPPGSSPYPAFNLDTTRLRYRGLSMGLVPPGSSPHPAFNLDATGSRSKEQRHALRTHQPARRIRAGLDHG
jgi:hypothetical protein